jgi:hypothetical protein
MVGAQILRRLYTRKVCLVKEFLVIFTGSVSLTAWCESGLFFYFDRRKSVEQRVLIMNDPKMT